LSDWRNNWIHKIPDSKLSWVDIPDAIVLVRFMEEQVVAIRRKRVRLPPFWRLDRSQSTMGRKERHGTAVTNEVRVTG